MDRHLDSIRQHPVALRAFFQQMPKGGDLHHHFEGSIYGETILEAIIEADYWVHPATLAIAQERPAGDSIHWQSLRTLAGQAEFPDLRRRLLQRWSVLDYTYTPADPPDRHFFGAFPAFLPAIPAVVDSGLLRLKARAIAENVQYLETIFLPFACPGSSFAYPGEMDGEMRSLATERDQETLYRLFDKIYEELETSGLADCAREHTERIELRHRDLGIDEERFHLRYQNYVLRVLPPTRLFADLAINFLSASLSPLIVSVNIVAPEHDPVALDDYWLHMQMYRYLSGRFPRLDVALHAGELVPGQVRPEDLTFHINQAVAIAGADRIGHGLTIPYEAKSDRLLRRMANERIAVEINLSSNRYILGLQPHENPLPLLLEQGVPVVISTDDAGVLRTSLTEQYVLLAQAFPQLSYTDIRAMVRNSIEFSFIREAAVKEAVLMQLEEALQQFEVFILDR